MIGAIKYALKEEHFALVAGAAVSLMLLGTVVYSLGEGWSVGDGRYFAFCTVTTQSIADPNLTLTHEWLKDFTILASTRWPASGSWSSSDVSSASGS